MRLFSSCKMKGLALGAGLLMTLCFVPKNLDAQKGDAAKGEKLFMQNCASCHNPIKVVAAPALKGVRKRWADAGIPDKMYEWVNNPKKILGEGHPYVVSLVNANKANAFMTAQGVNRQEVDDILAYVEAYTEPGAPTGGEQAISKAEMDKMYGEEEGSNWLWMVIFSVVFIVIILSVGGVRKQLKNANLEKLGKPVEKRTSYMGEIRAWAWRNKVTASLIAIFFVCGGVVEGWYELKDVGVYEGYKPEQPIWFSHQIHNGIYKIDCQYCHSAVEKGRHATLPAAMVCMNCHKSIQKGTLTGTEEISKIYAATGFDPKTNQYTNKSTGPIKWVKVHALPDHAYFNHSQHVVVGGLDCKQCHGEMSKIDVARIQPVSALNAIEGNVKIEGGRPTLTMGWCIECHQNADVKFTGGYYDELRKRLLLNKEEYKKHLADDRISVKDLGGWECSKCHY